MEIKASQLATSYPVIRGPSDATFEFSLEVDSELDKDAVFDLLAQGPKGWEINFKPAYETKYISGLRLKESRTSPSAWRSNRPSTPRRVNSRSISGSAPARPKAKSS